MRTDVKPTLGAIVEFEQRLEEVTLQIHAYGVQANDFKAQAALLREGSIDATAPLKIADFMRQAAYYDGLSDSLDREDRSRILNELNYLRDKASQVRGVLSHNRLLLEVREKELLDEQEEAAARLVQAEERVSSVRNLIVEQERELVELEGNG